MKQRARAQIASIKRSAIKQHQQRSGRLGQVKAYIAGEGEEGGEEATIELIKGERDADGELNNHYYTFIRILIKLSLPTDDGCWECTLR